MQYSSYVNAVWEDGGVSSSESAHSPQGETPADAAAPEVAGTAEVVAVSWHIPRLFIAWGVAAVAGVLVTLFADAQRAEWLVLAVGVSVLVTFALQLGTAQREGFISRLAFSISGSVLVIALIDVIGMLVETLSASA